MEGLGLIVGAALVAGYYLRERARAAVVQPEAPHPPSPPPALVSAVSQLDVQRRQIEDMQISDSETDWILHNRPDLTTPGYSVRRYWLHFYRHLWYPASILPLSFLTEEDVKLAVKLLCGGVTVKGCPYEEGLQRRMDDLSALQTAQQVADDVALAIASAAGYGQVASELHDARVKLGGDPLAHVADEMAASLGAGSTFDLSVVLGDVRKQKYTGVISGRPLRWRQRVVAPPGFTRPDGTPHDGPEFYARLELFRTSTQGRLLSWNSQDLGCGKKLSTRIVARARVFRALDMLGCTMFPHSADTDVHLYDYRNPRFGTMRGSIFPPTREDVAIGTVKRYAQPSIEIVRMAWNYGSTDQDIAPGATPFTGQEHMLDDSHLGPLG